MTGGSGGKQLHRQHRRAAHGERGHPLHLAPLHDDCLEARDERLQREPGLHAGQLRAQTEVDAMAEREVLGPLLPAGEEAVGLLEHPLVAVGGGHDRKTIEPRGHLRVAQSHVRARHAKHQLDGGSNRSTSSRKRTVCALSARASPGARGTARGTWPRCRSASSSYPCRRAAAGTGSERSSARELSAIDLRADQVTHHILSRLAAARGDDVAQVGPISLTVSRTWCCSGAFATEHDAHGRSPALELGEHGPLQPEHAADDIARARR